MTEAMIRKKPGMASVKDMPVLQDVPPLGGFAPIRWRILKKGPNAIAIFLTTFGVFSWGMYQVGLRRNSSMSTPIGHATHYEQLTTTA